MADPDAAQSVLRETASVEPLRDASCRNCELAYGCKTVCVPGVGPLTAELLVLGIAPGGKEDETGVPFVGQSGQLLRSVMHENGLLVNARLTNVVRCRPPENRDPTAAEQRACQVWFSRELAALPRLKFVVALGTIPMKAMGVQGSVNDLAGVPRKTLIDEEYIEDGVYKLRPREYIVIPVMHPAGVLRRQTYLSTWESHWHGIRNLIRPPAESFAVRAGAVLYEGGLQGKDWRNS